MALLEVRELTVHYGGALILDRVSLEVDKHDVVAVIGPNGAGKTTLLRAISGLTKSSGGTIQFDGAHRHRTKPHEIVKAGIVLCPEGRKLFPGMTVMENLLLGAYLRRDKKETETDLKQVFDLFPDLKAMKSRLSGTLSGGEQQMLAIGRALMGKPKLLLLDEPSAGLSPLYRTRIAELLGNLNQQGLPILLVEQDVRLAFAVCARAYVLEGGRITMFGQSNNLCQDEHIVKAYLGF